MPPSKAQRIAKRVVKRAKGEAVEALSDYTGEDGIIWFVRDVLGVDDIAPYQEDILRMFIRNRRVAARGAHGIGKTTMAAWIILYAVSVFPDDVKVVCTASVFRQLSKYLFPEVHKWARRANWSKVGISMRKGKELLEQSIKLTGKEAFAVAPQDETAIEGAHAKYIVYVFDEAKAIPDAVWDAAEGAFSTAGDDTEEQAYAFAISTPGNPQGRFYDIHKQKGGFEDWSVRHVTIEEAIAAGRVTREWVERRARQWGKNSAIYKNRVLGEFDTSGEDSVIPLDWVELANERWEECQGKGAEDAQASYGVDVARYGQDASVCARQVGNVLEWLQSWHKESTMQTAGRVINLVKRNKAVKIMVDVVGIGAGVTDRLKELGYRAYGVNVGEGTDDTTEDGLVEFVNLKAQIWWQYREALDPEGSILLALPPDDDLTADLTTPLYSYDSKGRIKVESKDDVRKRLNRSTDKADAAVLAYYGQRKAKLPSMAVLSRNNA